LAGWGESRKQMIPVRYDAVVSDIFFFWYCHISSITLLFLMDAPLASALPAFQGGGACDLSVLPVYLIPGVIMRSEPGRIVAGRSLPVPCPLRINSLKINLIAQY